MSREIRRVPKNWEHLKDLDGKFKPLLEENIPDGECYQLFENVSEGTPLSPPFATKEELIEWLVNNKDYWGHQWTKKQAEGIVKIGHVPSFALINGKFYKSEELADLSND